MFEIPESVRPIRDEVLRFIEEEIYPVEQYLRTCPPGSNPELERLRALAKERGLWALGHPKEIGGGGMPFFDYTFINEVIGRSSPAIVALGTATLQTSLMLYEHGGDAWLERVTLPQVAGEFECAFAMTEPDVASSDPTQLKTHARLDGDEWVITGRKWFISMLAAAKWVAVVARTEGDDAPPHRRFSVIMVPVDAPGFRILRRLNVLALEGVIGGHFEIEFDDVRVPADHLLGTRGAGFKIAQGRLGPGRIYHCMRWLGMAQRAFDLLCRRANERHLGGSPLGDRQLVQQMVYDSYVDIHQARLMVLDAAARIDAGSDARVEIGAAKVVCSNMAHRVIDRAMQVHGAYGTCDDLPLEYMYRHIRTGRFVDGPDEVHIQRIGRYLLGAYADGQSGWDFANPPSVR